MAKPRDVPRPFTMPWGKGDIIEEATAVGEYHEPAIQLLRYEDGSLSIRFSHYDQRGRFQRSPLMISSETIAGLRRSLADTPRLRALLTKLIGAPAKRVRAK
jgi:hypothetical protein